MLASSRNIYDKSLQSNMEIYYTLALTTMVSWTRQSVGN